MSAQPESPDGSAIALVDRPQRLGILPTWAFWRRVPGKVKDPIVFVGFTATLGTVLFAGANGPLVGAAAGAGGMLLVLGLTERYVRSRVLRRRRREAELEKQLGTRTDGR
jgi:hypothetical protein